LNGTNNCPEFQYFNDLAEVNAWSGEKVCCCTLWCNSKKAIDFSSWGVVFVLLGAIVVLSIISVKIFRKVKHRLENIPFLLGQYVYTPPLIAKHCCPYHLKAGTKCSHPWFFTLEALYHHCNVEHNVVDRAEITKERSKHLTAPKIMRGPEEEMFQYSGLIVSLVVYAILISPFVLVFILFFVVKGKLAGAYCLSVDGRGDVDEWVVSMTIFAALFGSLMALFAFERWQTRSWLLDNTVSGLFVGSFVCFFSPLVVYVVVYDQVKYKSDYTYVAAVFLTLNMLPAIIVNFSSVGTDLPLDISSFIKRYKNKRSGENSQSVAIVCGAAHGKVNGVYVPTPCATTEFEVPLGLVIPPPHIKTSLASMSDSNLKDMPVSILHAEGEKRVEGYILKVNREENAEVTFDIKLTLDFGESARGKHFVSSDPELFPTFAKVDWKHPEKFTHTISRHSFPAGPGQPSIPHWYICEGTSEDRYHSTSARYIARADPVDSGWPPSSGWHLVDNGAIPNHETSVPSIIMQDVTIFEAEYNAQVEADKAQRKFRTAKVLLYIFSFAMLLVFAFYTYNSVCIASSVKAAKFVGFFHFFTVIIVEIAVAWHYFAGLDTDSLTITYLHIVARIAMIGGGSKYYYLAGCFIYFVFAMLLVYHIVNRRWPILTSRQIIRRDLSSVLPAWLYSGGSGSSDDAPSGSAIDAKVLDDLLLAPLLKVADALDSIIERLMFFLPWRISTKQFLQATIQNPVWVLVYLSSLFFCGSLVFESHFPSLPMVEVFGVESTQSDIGRYSICSVLLVYFGYDALRSYKYYGHRIDRLPFKGATIRACVFTLSMWISGSVYYAWSPRRHLDVLVLILAVFSPLLATVGIWSIRNWAANDYVFLIDLNISGLRPPNFNDRLRKLGRKSLNLLDAKGFWKQLKFFVLDIIQKIRKSFFTMIGMGLYIFLSICVSKFMELSMPEVPNVFFRVLLALFHVLTCMYLAVVKWFSTFRLPVVVLCAGGAWVSFLSAELWTSGIAKEWQIVSVVFGIPLIQLVIMSLYQLYLDEFKIVWQLPPTLFASCMKRDKKNWSNIGACLTLCELSILVFLIVMPQVFHELGALQIPGVEIPVMTVLWATYFCQLIFFSIIYVWVDNHFVLPPVLKRVILSLVAAAMILLAIFSHNYNSSKFELIDVYILLSIVGCYATYKQAAASATIFYSENIFPVFSIDPRTHNLMDRSTEIKYAFYIPIFASVWGLYRAIAGDSLNGQWRTQSGFYIVCVITVFTVAVTGSLKRTTKRKFWAAWSRLKHYSDIIDHLRLETLKTETSSSMNSSKENGDKMRGDREYNLAMKNVVALSRKFPAKSKKKFHTYRDCVKAAGAVPASMPNLLSFIDKTLKETIDESANTLGDTFHNIVPDVIEDSAKGIYSKTIAVGISDVADLAKRGVEQSKQLAQEAILSSSRNLGDTIDDANIFKNQFKDIKFLVAGDADDEEDLPELLVSGCGLKSAEGLYCYVKGHSTPSLRYSRIGVGAEFEIHFRVYSQVNYWTIEYDNTPLYACRADYDVKDDNSSTNESPVFSLNPPITGWTLVCTPESKLKSVSPAPVVTSTELEDWGMVLRASNGILQWQLEMGRILEEERRIEARFRHFVIECASQQEQAEENLLWGFVRGCMPKLVEQRRGAQVVNLETMSADELRQWAKRKKKKLRELGRSYGNRMKASYEESRREKMKAHTTNKERKGHMKAENHVINFSLTDEILVVSKLCDEMLRFCKRFNRSQNVGKMIQDFEAQMKKLRSSSKSNRSARKNSELYQRYSSIIESLRGIAADSSTAGDAKNAFEKHYETVFERLALEYSASCPGKVLGNPIWKESRHSSLSWGKPPKLFYHWLDEGFLIDKKQDDAVRTRWDMLKTEGFALGGLESDIIAMGNYRYFKTLPGKSKPKDRFLRAKALVQFKKDFLSRWYNDDKFVKIAKESVPEEWGLSLHELHALLTDEHGDAVASLEYFDPHCTIDSSDKSLYEAQLEFFKLSLEKGVIRWESSKDSLKKFTEMDGSETGNWPLFCPEKDGSQAADPADINQGDANDCWLLSAMMIAAAKDQTGSNIISNLFVNYQEDGDTKDVQIVKFFRPDTGLWEYVVIDNAVPVRKPAASGSQALAKPKYACSRQPETWVMLLEKAYAKWITSRVQAPVNKNPYENINFGLIDEALVSFTGGVKSLIPLDTPEGQANARSGALWNKLVEFQSKGYLLGASTPSGHDAFWDEHGLVKGHAYAILSIMTTSPPSGVKSGSKIMLIRNPWGINPWDFDPPAHPSKDQPWPIKPLDWSPRSSMWQGKGAQYMKRKLQVSSNSGVDPGVFWITYEDFVRSFAAIFCCRMLDGWITYSKLSEWREGRMGGVISGPSGFENPQWRLKVLKNTAAYFTLSQTLSASYCYMMLAVVPGGKQLRRPVGPDVIKSSTFFYSGAPDDSREIGFDVPLLPPGDYTIIASTFEPGETTGCRLSVYFKEPGSVKEEGFVELN
jgi:hypothetical protein